MLMAQRCHDFAKVISEDDVEALLKAAHKLQTAEDRLTCLLEIAYASGLE